MTKILLVEDDKSLREIYGVRLLAEGYDIVSAGDGEEALAMAIKERPHLIVSDVMMPKISGFDMLDILRSTTETRDIKVIMMTALSSEDQRLRGEQLGADKYLVKSQVGIEDVVRTVHEVLGDAPSARVDDSQIFNSPAPRPTTPGQGQPQQTMQQHPQQPQASPTPQPQQQTQQAQPAPQPAFRQTTTPSSPLPQPTAPFSSPRPANLGDRIIHPLGKDEPGRRQDVATLMNQELERAGSVSAPERSPQPREEAPSMQRPEQPQNSQPSDNPLAPPPPPSAPNPEFMSPDEMPHGAVAFNPQPSQSDESAPQYGER